MNEEDTRTLSGAEEKFLAALDTVPSLRSAQFVGEPVTEKWSQGFRFHGLVGVFGEPYDLGLHSEEIERGSWRKYQATGDSIPFLLEHNSTRLPLATTHAKTLVIEEVPKGIQVDADIADTTDGRDLYVSTQRGDVRGMSWGAVVGRGNSKVTMRNGKPHRVVQGFKKILDVSATWNPASPATTAEFRSSAEFRSAALKFLDQPDVLQLLLEGDLPQLENLGGTSEETEAESRTDDGRTQNDATGATGLSVAARKRALQFLILNTGGLDDAS